MHKNCHPGYTEYNSTALVQGINNRFMDSSDALILTLVLLNLH